jgi:hypothetical protein
LNTTPEGDDGEAPLPLPSFVCTVEEQDESCKEMNHV